MKRLGVAAGRNAAGQQKKSTCATSTTTTTTTKRRRMVVQMSLVLVLLVVIQGQIERSFQDIFFQNQNPDYPELDEATSTGLQQEQRPRRYPPVDCVSLLQGRPHNVDDPNRSLEESPNKWVNATNPSFKISLHSQGFDPMRWASIMNRGNYYETGVTEQFHQILYNAPKGLVIDVGMNIGWFTAYSRAMGHAVVAFDPNPIMHTRVCETLALNGWNDTSTTTTTTDLKPLSPFVRTFPYGLAGQLTTMNLTLGKNPGGSSFHQDRLAQKFRRYLPVQVVTLDDMSDQEGWILETSPEIHVMKVDVEGFEPQVLKGATRLLASGKVQNMIMENSFKDDSLAKETLSTIYRAGYHVHFMSSVNGDAYHQDWVPTINRALDTQQMDIPELELFSKTTINLWWKKKTSAAL